MAGCCWPGFVWHRYILSQSIAAEGFGHTPVRSQGGEMDELRWLRQELLLCGKPAQFKYVFVFTNLAGFPLRVAWRFEPGLVHVVPRRGCAVSRGESRRQGGRLRSETLESKPGCFWLPLAAFSSQGSGLPAVWL